MCPLPASVSPAREGSREAKPPQPVSLTHVPPACTHKTHLPLPAVPLTFFKSLPAPPSHPPPPPPFAPPASPARNPIPTCTPMPCPYPHPCRYPDPCPHPIPGWTVPMATAAHPAPTSRENGGESTAFSVLPIPSVRRPRARAWGLPHHPPRSGDTQQRGPSIQPLSIPILPWQQEHGVPPLRVPVPTAPGMGVSGTEARGRHPGLPPVRRGGGR